MEDGDNRDTDQGAEFSTVRPGVRKTAAELGLNQTNSGEVVGTQGEANDMDDARED